jgi:glycine/D-amino acid oxidase-like deaminating enzyme
VRHTEVAVVGGGIVGLAHAYEAFRRGQTVALFERSPRAVGASIRNFGMFWPIGQPAGRAYARALRSRGVYLDLAAVRDRYRRERPHFDRWGIHVLVSQTRAGELTIGDSHEYGEVHDPFNREDIDGWILEYLLTFVRAPDLAVAQRWNGQYLKRTDGHLEYVREVEPRVHVVTRLGGNGMTLSFGLAWEVFEAAEGGGAWVDTPA